MEHIEEAGVHSGDSACALPPYSLPAEVLDEIRTATQSPRERTQRPRADEHSIRGEES